MFVVDEALGNLCIMYQFSFESQILSRVKVTTTLSLDAIDRVIWEIHRRLIMKIGQYCVIVYYAPHVLYTLEISIKKSIQVHVTLFIHSVFKD